MCESLNLMLCTVQSADCQASREFSWVTGPTFLERP